MKTLLLARCSSLIQEHPSSPLVIARGSNDYTAERGVFCKYCKDTLADTWHIALECTGPKVQAARWLFLSEIKPTLLALLKDLCVAASTFSTIKNRFSEIATCIEANMQGVESFDGHSGDHLQSFLAFRALLALPFHTSSLPSPLPHTPSGHCAIALARIFEATTLPMNLMRKPLTAWAKRAAKWNTDLLCSWKEDCNGAQGEWTFVTSRTDLVSACGVRWNPSPSADSDSLRGLCSSGDNSRSPSPLIPTT